MLQVTVAACEMLAEAGSGGSLYTAYRVEARSSPLQPSWIVRRRFRSLTLLLTLAVVTVMAVTNVMAVTTVMAVTAVIAIMTV